MTLQRRGIIIIPLVILMSGVIGGIYGPRVTAQSDATDAQLQDTLRRVTTVLQSVEKEYADPVDMQQVIYNGAIPGMLRSLDPHSNFFDPKSFAQLREDQRGRYYGVGMTLTNRNGKTMVLAPFVGSPAYKAGLRPGDEIIQADDTPTENVPMSQVADLLKGPRGTSVRITVRREGSPEPLQFLVVRDEIPRPSVEHAFEITPDIGYVRINSFQETTSKELQEKLRELKTQDLKGLILDLRGNPGGLLAEGVAVSEMFLQRGQLVVSHRGRSSREKQYVATRNNRGDSVPLVVVINRMTASAAEIVSGAIQDHDRGLIIGEPSFGKGLVQTVYPLSENTGLALTTAKYYTPSGRLIQRNYTGVSLYDYTFQKEGGKAAQTEMKTTDAGRTVYGGGGITPDVEVPELTLNRFQQTLARKYAFFNFAKRYLAENKTIERDFEATPAVLDRFRRFLGEEQIEFKDHEITENIAYIRENIKEELILSVFGMEDAYRVDVAADTQIQRAIELLPQAAAMLANTRRAKLE
ncbi:MAG: S41 family peptidase [Acidobacteria bacterium]|nr:S41 family peptidase [Acidobacteriota bacterium]